MTNRRPCVAAAVTLLVLVSACSKAPTASQLRDRNLSKMIVGSWIVSRNSPEYYPLPLRETFAPDGTYRTLIYSDATCANVIGEAELKWRIRNGILVQRFTKVTGTSAGHVGQIVRDRIVSLSTKRMVLRSLDSGTKEIRIRSSGCLDPQ